MSAHDSSSTSRVFPWVTWSILLLVIGLGIGSAANGQVDVDPITPRDAQLQGRLDAALTAKGPAYIPRTEHRLSDGRPRYTNRLILEDSPYLIQHAHNPVDWYPWAAEAFEKARRENKLVFLSIGYSTCHWCHVMERESFENLEIARLLNRDYVAIKLDREVRPDLDQVYMSALELISGQGGWPMSSILTPQGETIIAGTYFSPADFTRLIVKAQALWKQEPELLIAQAKTIAAAVSRRLDTDRQTAELDQTLSARAVQSLLIQHDDLQGGFVGAPKFPRESSLALLIDHSLRENNSTGLDAALFTLRAMARGGIHDQAGGGFHRYAIDHEWLVPHFEKMLYNQAQLAPLYATAARITGDPELARVARDTLDFVLRDLTSPEGGFYCATDADSEGAEGRFFLWTPDQIRAVLPPQDAELAIRFYGVSEAGNFEGSNILHVPLEPIEFARNEGLPLPALFQRLDQINRALYVARETRPHPHLDNKILTAWNGMMIASMAQVGATLGEPVYIQAAERAARLLWTQMRPAPGALLRVYLNGRASLPALQEDYAFLGLGMIALYDATDESLWLTHARELADTMWLRFADPDGGGLFMAEPATDTPQMARPKDMGDGSIQSGTSAALSLLAGLARRGDSAVDGERAKSLLAAVSGQVQRMPSAFPSLLIGLNRLRHGETGPKDYAGRGAIRVEARIEGNGNPDATRSLTIDLDIAPGWHINAQKPLQDYLIPTRLGIAGDETGWKLADPDYPEPRIITLGFESEPLALYQGRIRIASTITPIPEQGDPRPWLPVELRLQACSDRLCLPPETLWLQVPIPRLDQ